MNINNVNSTTPVVAPQVPLFTPTTMGPPPKDPQDLRVKGNLQPAEAAQEVKTRPIDECRDAFKTGLANLKGQTDDDKQAIRDIAKMVNERSDLNSKEKEWLFATEMIAYTADAAMTMTGWEKKGQPWTPKQQDRFSALTETHAAAKDLVAAVTPLVEKPDTQPQVPTLAEKLKAAEPATPAASASPAPAENAPPSNTPPGSSDPLVRIWESRRQEAQDMMNDYKALMQKITEWKQRILASRIAFFWKVYGAHTGFLNDSWRK